MKNSINIKIGIIGMGYVGLPLAVEFVKHYNVIGFDIDIDRISELKLGNDITREVNADDLRNSEKLELTSNFDDLLTCNVYIVTVPTPVDKYKQPDLKSLLQATMNVGKVLCEGDVVIYESTVYPGLTEDECVPILQKASGLKLNKDFYVGYSPERVNPGDRDHRLPDIVKVTSGSNSDAAKFVDELYQKIITAGTYKAKSIKEAEAAKVIENTQRDLNIALINELSIIFDKMDIDTEGVLKAADTKWNFLSFRPGLVGGHCIGVDPYYLTYKAESLGYRPEIILSGRRLNDSMSNYVVNKIIKEMSKKRINANEAKILIMGVSFKENCPDIRNSKAIDVVHELKDYGCKVSVYDPLVCPDELKAEYGITKLENLQENFFDAIIITVGHQIFKKMGIKHIRSFGKNDNIVYDLKYLFDANEVDLRL